MKKRQKLLTDEQWAFIELVARTPLTLYIVVVLHEAGFPSF